MTRVKWLKLIVFLGVCALILLFPLYKFWLFEYTPGIEIALPISAMSSSGDESRDFRLIFPFHVPAAKDAPQLSEAYAGFSVKDGVAEVTGIVASKKDIPSGTPFVKVKHIFIVPTWKDGKPGAPYFYGMTFPFQTYTARDAAEAKMLRERMKKDGIDEAKLVVVLYADGDYRVKEIRFD